MSTTGTTPTTSPVTSPVTNPPQRAWRLGTRRLGGRARKVTLLVHIIAAGTWIGIDVVVAIMVLVGWFAESDATRGTAYQALGLFAVWPMLIAGLTSLASGLVLGWGSKYGLIRYWWVAVKLVLNVVLTTLVLLALRPSIPDVVAHGQALSAGQSSDRDVSQLFFPPAVSLVALTFATTLSVFKPWGRVRRVAGGR